MDKVLFVCIDNAGLSQMAEAFFNRAFRGKRLARSAGVLPAKRLDDNVIEIMWEIGIEIGPQRTKLLTPGLLKWADRIITLGSGVLKMHLKELSACENWEAEDTEDQPVEKLRETREEIQTLVWQTFAGSSLFGSEERMHLEVYPREISG